MVILKLENDILILFQFWKFLRRIYKEYLEKGVRWEKLWITIRIIVTDLLALEMSRESWIIITEFFGISKNLGTRFRADLVPNDLKCHVCNIKCNKHSTSEQHFSSNKHKIYVWNCTPKYFAPFGVHRVLKLRNCGKRIFLLESITVRSEVDPLKVTVWETKLEIF